MKLRHFLSVLLIPAFVSVHASDSIKEEDKTSKSVKVLNNSEDDAYFNDEYVQKKEKFVASAGVILTVLMKLNEIFTKK